MACISLTAHALTHTHTDPLSLSHTHTHTHTHTSGVQHLISVIHSSAPHTYIRNTRICHTTTSATHISVAHTYIHPHSSSHICTPPAITHRPARCSVRSYCPHCCHAVVGTVFDRCCARLSGRPFCPHCCYAVVFDRCCARLSGRASGRA